MSTKGAAEKVGRTQSRVFVYDPHRYLFDVKITGVVGIGAAAVGAGMLVTRTIPLIAAVVLVLGLYTAFNTFAARCYPRVVTIDDQRVVFESFGRTDEYRLDDITRIQLRENGKTLSLYVRLNGGGLLKGRYFMGCGDMTDASGEPARALYDFFLDMQARLDPDNLRVRARSQAGAASRKQPAQEKTTGVPQRKKGAGR